MRHPDVINARNEIARSTVRVVCESCGEVLFERPQKQVNGAPSTSKVLIDQAMKKHGLSCSNGEVTARVERMIR